MSAVSTILRKNLRAVVLVNCLLLCTAAIAQQPPSSDQSGSPSAGPSNSSATSSTPTSIGSSNANSTVPASNAQVPSRATGSANVGAATPAGSPDSAATGPNGSAASSLASVSPDARTGGAAANPDLVIGSGDLVEVAVYGADFDKLARVSENGQISLPLIGTIKIGGMTVAAAERLIEKKMADGGYFNDPQVSIFEKEYATQGISVLGEVQKPGIYSLLGPRTLLDAISAAGGTTDKAGDTVTIKHRSDPNHAQVVQLFDRGRKMDQANVPVQAGDTVVVSKAGIVYVVGNVQKPGGFIMDGPRFTVLQAIAMAQGTAPNASLNDAKLIRATPQGPQEQPLSLKAILSAKAPDVTLQPDDIVFVPNSAAKSAAKRGLEAALQAATGIAIYSHP